MIQVKGIKALYLYEDQPLKMQIEQHIEHLNTYGYKLSVEYNEAERRIDIIFPDMGR